MKTVEDLTQYYETSLKPDLMVLDEERLRIKKKLVPLIVIDVIVLIISFVLIVHFSVSINWMLLPLCFCGILIFGWYLNFYRGFLAQFKEQVIKKIVAFIDPGLTYQKDQCVPKTLFTESLIFRERADRYEGDDFVSGRIDKTDIQFSEVNVKRVEKTGRKTGTGSERKTKTHTYPIFKGLFFVADFNKDFNKKTIVLPDKAEKLFGRLGQKLQSMNNLHGELIKLEDPDFEKQFVVYGDDQVESRYILSTSLMRRISDFRKKSNKEIFLSFVASKLFVAIPYKKSLFEPSIFTSLVDFSKVQEYFEDLQIAIDIVGDLNLNTRIWTKA